MTSVNFCYESRSSLLKFFFLLFFLLFGLKQGIRLVLFRNVCYCETEKNHFRNVDFNGVRVPDILMTAGDRAEITTELTNY